MIDITNWQKLLFWAKSFDKMSYTVCLYPFHILGMNGYQTGHPPCKKLFMNKYIKKSSAYDEECMFFRRQGDANSDRTYKWMTLLCWCRLHACHNHDWWASIHQHLENNKDLSLSSTFFSVNEYHRSAHNEPLFETRTASNFLHKSKRHHLYRKFFKGTLEADS